MELVQNCRADGFGIWPTLSAPVQIRIGILNQLLNPPPITEIVTRRFADAMRALGADVDQAAIERGARSTLRTGRCRAIGATHGHP